MLITFPCAQCRVDLEVDATAADTEVECPECRTSLVVPRKGVEPGTTLGGFRITSLLGIGGMGEVFAGMPLQVLKLNSSRSVVDLKPLAGMPLRVLGLYSTAVTDLSPLRGMPLNDLVLSCTSVADLSPLRKLPLARIGIRQSPNIKDLSPLKDIPGLKIER